MFILLVATIIIFSGIALFFGKELIKKFGFWKKFESTYQKKISWTYSGDLKPGMYKLQLTGKGQFSALIGFELSILRFKNIGYDVFGYIESDTEGYAECVLYLGKGGVEFIFLLNEAMDIRFSYIPWDGNSTEYIFKPHWWQRL